MEEELLNVQVRKFLKKVGIRSQLEIENTIKKKFENGLLDEIDFLDISVLLEIKKVGLKIPIKGKIELKKK